MTGLTLLTFASPCLKAWPANAGHYSRKAGGQVIVSVQNPFHLDDYSEPEPDIALLKPRADFYSESLPTPADVLLIIEVADTSVDADRRVKVPLYA